MAEVQVCEETFPVTVEPDGIVLHCRSGETLIQCAWRHSYYWPTICGGAAECGACRCELVNNGTNAESAGPQEQLYFRRYSAHLPKADHPLRLACRMTVTGPVTVYKTGVAPR